MSKKLISIIVSLGVCAGGAGITYSNSKNVNHKNIESSQNVSNENTESTDAQQAEVASNEANVESTNPFTKVLNAVSKTFSKDEGNDTTKKEDSSKETSQEEEVKLASNDTKNENDNNDNSDINNDKVNNDQENDECPSIFGFNIPWLNNDNSNKGKGQLEIINSGDNNSCETQNNQSVNKPAASKPVQKPTTNKPVEKPNNTTPVQKPENKPVQKPAEKPVEQPSDGSSYVAQIEQMIFNKVNEERAKAGVAPLSYNNTMQKYARIKSEDMGVRKYFAHEDPNGQLITAKMKADGVSYNAWGENIAYLSGYSGDANLANQFMTNWMNSSGHRANILSSNFTSIGVGVYKIGNTYYATQEFMK